MSDTNPGLAALKAVEGRLRDSEARLRDSEDRFRLLVESVEDYAILMLDPQGRVTSWNAGAERIQGWRADEVLGRHFSVFYPPEDIDAGKPGRELAAAAATGRVEDEGWRIRRDGSRFWATVAITAFRDSTGRLRGFAKVTRDDTDRRRIAEEQTHRVAEAAEQQSLFELAHDAIIVRRFAGGILLWNRGAQELYGWPAEEAIGASCHSMLRTQADPPLDEIEESLRRDGRWEGELVQLTRDGLPLLVASRWAMIHSGDRDSMKVLEINRDVTESRATEERLRESDDRCRLLVSSILDYGILMLDPQGRVTSWNAGAERIKGWREEEILGRHFSLFYPPEDVARGKPDRELRAATAAGRMEDEGWRVRKDGSRFWARVVITALRDASGQLRGFGKVTRDETERRRTDEELRRHATDLTAVNAELETFASAVSHDLRAPLRGIDGFSQALMEDAGDRLLDRDREYLTRIRSNTQRMAQLIDDLLSLSRLTRQPMRTDAVDLSTIAGEIAGDLGASQPGRAVEFVIQEGIRVHGDQQLLRIALTNLLENAWKYTANQAPARIAFGVEGEGPEARYFVRDNGIGFNMAYADRIFQPFQRLHGSEEYTGTGVGLATVKRVVTRHGGSIGVSSAEGEGASFSFTLAGGQA